MAKPDVMILKSTNIKEKHKVREQHQQFYCCFQDNLREWVPETINPHYQHHPSWTSQVGRNKK